MDTKLTAALACVAALALGACSGGPADPDPETTNPATPADPGPGNTDPIPETADPPEDGRTEAERFDDELAKAEADLSAARERVLAAVAAATGTRDGRTRALAGIAAARKDLTDALSAARALQAPQDDSEKITRAARLAFKADAAEAEDLPKLRRRKQSGMVGVRPGHSRDA